MTEPQGPLTQLSYYRPDLQRARPPVPPALVACAVAMIAVGFGLAWVAASSFLRMPVGHFWWKLSSFDDAMYGGWAIAFILLGVAVGRARWWMQFIVLAVLPVFFVMYLGSAIHILVVGPNSGHAAIFPNVAVLFGALLTSALIFAYFCTPTAARSFGHALLALTFCVLYFSAAAFGIYAGRHLRRRPSALGAKILRESSSSSSFG